MSLVEMLAALAVGFALVASIGAGISGSVKKSRNAQCLAKLRLLGNGILYCVSDTGEFPRSLHSAAAAGVQPWARALLPYLELPPEPSPDEWERLFQRYFRCPADTNRSSNVYSYGLNVFFELNPDGDDYDGNPASWRRPANIERPGSTILLAEPRRVLYADHVMSHLWTGAGAASNALDGKRHGRAGLNFLFVDGHAETLPVNATFDPAAAVNLWNPLLARKK